MEAWPEEVGKHRAHLCLLSALLLSVSALKTSCTGDGDAQVGQCRKQRDLLIAK